MYKPEYPEWGRREAMLWAVYEWCQDQPAGEDMIWEHEVATLVSGGEYVLDPWTEDPDKQVAMKFQAEQVNLFITLIREGLIDADLLKPLAGRPMTQARVRGLHAPGLRLIRELPDPQRSLVEGMDQMAEAIRNLKDVPEEEKKAAEKAAEEIGNFARNATPAAAVQLLVAFAQSRGLWP